MATNNAINGSLIANGVLKGNSAGTAYDNALITAGAVLAANSSGVPTSSAALTLNGVLLGGGTGVPTASAAFSANGQLLIGNGSSAPSIALLTAGAGISIANGAGSITISSTGGPAWVNVTGTSASMAVNTGYVANNASLVSLSLPASSAIGDELSIQGNGAGGWLISQGAGQIVHIGSVASTAGAGGSIASSNRYDSAIFVCVVANLEWAALGGAQGNLTIV